MLVLTIIAVIISISIVGWGLYIFEDSSDKKFGYRFFSVGSFSALGLSTFLCFFGYIWWESESSQNGDTLNGMIVAGFGVALVLATLFVNFKMTNFIYGIFGSVIQLALFSVLLPLAIGFALLQFIAVLFEGHTTQNVRVVD